MNAETLFNCYIQQATELANTHLNHSDGHTDNHSDSNYGDHSDFYSDHHQDRD